MRLNEKLIDLMNKLSVIMKNKGEQFRARAYEKAGETIIGIKTDITDVVQLKKMKGIGPSILEKMETYILTDTLDILEADEKDPTKLFGDIYGIGPKKAKELVDLGIKDIPMLREQQNSILNNVQKIGLKYYEDILERIPRSEIDNYLFIFNEAFSEIVSEKTKETKETQKNNSKFEIVGSYRRGAANSGDIDCIFTSSDKTVFKKFIDVLVEKKIIIEILSRGPMKCLVITKLPGVKFARRVDFLFADEYEYAFSLLYFTGSKSFNTDMRGYCLTQGYTLNEHGLYKMTNNIKGEKVSNVIFREEKDIFDFLKYPYKSPVERNIS
jgi:DNA polymerase/3'-5' exonuclease PolX